MLLPLVPTLHGGYARRTVHSLTSTLRISFASNTRSAAKTRHVITPVQKIGKTAQTSYSERACLVLHMHRKLNSLEVVIDRCSIEVVSQPISDTAQRLG